MFSSDSIRNIGSDDPFDSAATTSADTESSLTCVHPYNDETGSNAAAPVDDDESLITVDNDGIELSQSNIDAEADLENSKPKSIEDEASFSKTPKTILSVRSRCKRYMIAPISILVILLLIGIISVSVTNRSKNSVSENKISAAIAVDSEETDVAAESGTIVEDTMVSLRNDTDTEEPVTPSPSASPSQSPSMSPSQMPSKTTPAPTSTPWKVAAEVTTSNGGGNKNSFGSDVSLSAYGRHLAVGVPGDGNGNIQLFKRDNNNNWVQYGGDLDEHSSLFSFGASVKFSSDGKRISVRTLSSSLLIGGVYAIVYEYSPTNGKWINDSKYVVRDSAYDISKSAMAFSGDGNTLALAATNVYGATLVTILYDGLHSYFLTLHDAFIRNSDEFMSISDNGKRLAYSNQDRVYVKELYQATVWLAKWRTVGKGVPGETSDKAHSSSVVLSGDGNFLAVASKNNTRVYQSPLNFDRDREYDGPWEQVGETIGNDDGSVTTSISLSENGSILAVSTLGGSVRVFGYNTAIKSWVLKGPTLMNNDDVAVSQNKWPSGFGNAMSLSADGKTVAIGAPKLTQTENFDTGKVVIYEQDS